MSSSVNLCVDESKRRDSVAQYSSDARRDGARRNERFIGLGQLNKVIVNFLLGLIDCENNLIRVAVAG